MYVYKQTTKRTKGKFLNVWKVNLKVPHESFLYLKNNDYLNILPVKK